MSVQALSRSHRRRTRQTYLLRDDFGGVQLDSGLWVLTDTSGNVSVSGGKVNFAAGLGAPSGDDPAFRSREAFVRHAGLTLVWELTSGATTTQKGCGWNNSTSISITNGSCIDLTTGARMFVEARDGEALEIQVPMPYVAATSYLLAEVLKASGALYYLSTDAGLTWYLLFSTANGTTSPLYAIRNNPSGASTSSRCQVIQGSVKPPLYSVAAAQGPTVALGADLWDAAAAAFTSGTYAWAPYSANTIANDANTLKITYVNGTGGNGANDNLRDDADLSADLTPGIWYQVAVDAKVNTGSSVSVKVRDSVSDFLMGVVTGTNFATVSAVFRCISATGGILRGGVGDMAAGEILWLDNPSIKPFTATSLLFGGCDAGSKSVQCRGTWVVPAGKHGGYVICLDDAATPLNYIKYYIDRTAGKIYAVKYINGSPTDLGNGTITYADDAEFDLVKTGDYMQCYYGGAVPTGLGAQQYAGVGTWVKGFGTDDTVLCSGFTIETGVGV